MAWSDSVCADCHDHLASEELSEEDQQLKNELDMLVERLTVRRISVLGQVNAAYMCRVGIKCVALQTGHRGHQHLHQDIDLLHDSGP